MYYHFHVTQAQVHDFNYERTCCQMQWSDRSDLFMRIRQTVKMEFVSKNKGKKKSSSEITRSVWRSAIRMVRKNIFNAGNIRNDLRVLVLFLFYHFN